MTYLEAPARVDAARPATPVLPSHPHPGRWRKFLSYYRPHLGLLAADLAWESLAAQGREVRFGRGKDGRVSIELTDRTGKIGRASCRERV